MKFGKEVYKTITKKGKTEMVEPKMWLPQKKVFINRDGHLVLNYRKVDENINRVRYKATLNDTVVTYDTPNPNVEYVDMYVHTTLENGETKAVRKTYKRYKGELYD